ncbi:hypothetical protein DID80_01390 [Candidatus Marinamargulisbacteria bacterium SCGC AAA071-K20]|nr:hypothetical protein DID80_01390 [Candidatus Marinamargulisbacteria bacterium SCGC AAA071-K20]
MQVIRPRPHILIFLMRSLRRLLIMIELLWVPFLACISLVLIHVYFGAQVLKRGILFIDLALAQWAAFGYLIGHWFELDSFYVYAVAFSFTVFASLILSVLTQVYKDVNYQEAVIGVLYILATALSVGFISMTGMEGFHLKEMLAGHLLFVELPEVFLAVTIYSAVAMLLVLFNRWWQMKQSALGDFIFYLLFGLVVTSSVKMVGLLLVFSFLVIPVLTVVLLTESFKKRVFYGWGIGILSSVIGLIFSLIIDVPPSYSIILVLCVFWVLSTLLGLREINWTRHNIKAQ